MTHRLPHYLFTSTVLMTLLATQAWAHYPTLDCLQQHTQLICTAGYSDGSIAFDEPIEVRGYDESLIIRLISNQDGQVTFLRPPSEFYVLFDPGHEDPAEFDYAEL